jgi:uncharacterized protein YjiS (DUF1127 family)
MVPEGLHGVLSGSTAPVRANIVLAFIAGVCRIPQRVNLWLTRIETRRSLSMLSEHVLLDIGLTRADVNRELMKPFWRD